ncbi:autotransporter outer membrane beta-barrel domain-containing protein, partial [Prochlorococcus sp. AH-736-N10]|nr:autotransporter outer membrane beta-barrel domain-containing protein [Prochlorococcus sp. AH-736-N10]
VETDTYSSQLGGSVEEIQDQEEAPASDQDTTYYLSFSFVFTNEAATTSNGVINNHIPIDPAANPTTKADVNGLAESWTNAAIRFNKSSLKAVNKRFNWLRSNQNSERKSHQGINISFDNPLLEKALNGSTKRVKDLNNRHVESWARSNWSNERLKNESGKVFSDLIDNSVNLAFAELRENTFKPNLNPTGGELVGNWSLWTNGEILVGNKGISSKSSEQDINSLFLTLGIDKPFKDNGLFGFAFNYGKDDISVGNAGSGIDSINLGFNLYSSNLLKNKFTLESQIGFGNMDMNTKRIDNTTTHKGNRDVYMIFGSGKILAEPFEIKNFRLTPYGRLDLAHINLKAFSESGSSLALTFKDQIVNRKMVSLGLNLDRDLIFENWRLKPFLGISYGYDFTGDSIIDMNYVGDSQNYRIILDELSSNYLNTNIGFEFFRDNDWSGSISYEHERAGSSSHINSYQFNISLFF